MDLHRPLLAGNWKMNHGPAEARLFFERFVEAYAPTADRSVIFFPPAVSLPAAADALRGRADLLLGVQNVHWEEKGAFTGEISVAMAAEAGARMALIGHSERRHVFGETNEDTARKTKAVLAGGLVPVLCVGETLEEREDGSAADVVREQLHAVLIDVGAEVLDRIVIAYEPVWAIGTGRTASPGDAAEMHGEIRAHLRHRFATAPVDTVPILYGGSVKPDNARDLLSANDVDGVLVGGASLDPAGFARICTVSG